MIRIGTHYGFFCTNWEDDVIPVIKRVANIGYDVLEISTIGLLDSPRSHIQDIVDAAADYGVELTHNIGMKCEYDMASEDAAVRARGVELVKRVIDTIALMNGSLLCGNVHVAWLALPNTGITDKTPYIDRMLDSFLPLVSRIEDANIYYGFEVVNRFEQFITNTAAEAVALLQKFGGSPNIGITLDTFHMNIEEDSFKDAIHLAGDHLFHLHVGEANRKTPGTGRLPWGEIAGALRDIHYDQRVLMEPFVKMGGNIGADIHVWRDLSDQADEKKMDAYATEALAFMRKTFC